MTTWFPLNKTLHVSGYGSFSFYHSDYETTIHITLFGFSALSTGCFVSYINLETVLLPESITTIGNNILSGTKVSELFLPSKVQFISGSQSFDWDYYLRNVFVHPSNPYFLDVEGVLYSHDKKTLYFYPGNRTETTIYIPNGVHTIELAAFAHSNNREEIILPSSIKTIESHFGFYSHVLSRVIILQCESLISFNHASLFSGTNRNSSIISFNPKCFNTIEYSPISHCQIHSFTTLLVFILVIIGR